MNGLNESWPLSAANSFRSALSFSPKCSFISSVHFSRFWFTTSPTHYKAHMIENEIKTGSLVLEPQRNRVLAKATFERMNSGIRERISAEVLLPVHGKTLEVIQEQFFRHTSKMLEEFWFADDPQKFWRPA